MGTESVIQSAGKKHKPDGYSVVIERHAQFQAVYLLEGSLLLTTDAGDTRVCAHDILVLPVGCDCSYVCPDGGYEGLYYVLVNDPDPIWTGRASVVHADRRLQLLASLMDQEIRQPSRAAQRVITSLGALLAAYAVRQCETPPHTADRKTYQLYWAQSVRAALDTAVHAGASSHEALASLPMSYRQAARHFQAVYGQSPKAYLASVRIREGVRLLEQSALTVTEIALMLGYASAQHFSTDCRKHTGQCPRDIRRDLPPA